MHFLDMEMLVPKDHLVRKIDNTIDLEFLKEKVKYLYSGEIGIPSIDPVVDNYTICIWNEVNETDNKRD